MGDLKRSRSDRWFMGVCGGIARSMDVPAIWIRLATIAAAILLVPGPSFLIVGGAYLALGYFLPEDQI